MLELLGFTARGAEGQVANSRRSRVWPLCSKVHKIMPTGPGAGTQPDLSTPTISDKCVQADGLRVRFWQAGSGPALVLMHGLLGYSFSWRGVIPSLAQDREVFAPDMPGAGFSECRADLDCSLPGAARRLLGFMDAAGVRCCDLIGSSYGGATAIMLAGLIPSRIRNLVLVSPANPWSRIGRKRLALLRNPLIARLFPKVARAVRPMHKYFVRRMWGDSRLVTAETLEGYVRPLLQPGIFEHAVKTVRTWHADMTELESALPKIVDIPTLLVWGSKDRVVDPTSAELMAKRLPGARVAVLQGAGHLPYEECPEEFCRIIQDFLCDVSAAESPGLRSR
jgi:pimeloyl-ACP methyl ester carboxylesterase